MKFTAIILLSACLTASAGGHAQSISISEKNASLEEVFQHVRAQSGFPVLYTRSMVANAPRVSVSLQNVSLQQAMDEILKNQTLSYSIINNTIIIKEKTATPNNEAGSVGKPPLPIDIRGRITNENGEPVVASVVVKGTGNGTTSNAEGYFELQRVEPNAVLVISGVSIETKEVNVSGRTMLTVLVKISASEEGAVTVNTGYWSTSKRKSTGNISKVTSKDIERQPVTTPLMALQGRVPGLDITPRTGVPGTAVRIRVRGQNSIRWDAGDPLYIIDGVPVDSKPLQTGSGSNYMAGASGFDPLNSLNPADIESIEVLKDADATAIYGSRGANGIILITTKRGQRSGKTNVDVMAYHGAGKIVNRIDLLNTQQYLTMRREAFANDGTTPGQYNYDVNGAWDTTRYTDWQEALLGGSSKITDLQVNLSGGNGNTSFRMGGAYHKETVYYSGDFGFQRFNTNLSVNHISSNQKFRANVAMNYGTNRNNLFSSDQLVSAALSLAPNAPALYDAAGKLNWQIVDGSNSWGNPLAELERRQEVKTGSLAINGSVSYELLPGVLVKTNIGFTELQSKEVLKSPLSSSSPTLIGPGSTASATFSQNKRQSWIIEPQLSYNKTWGSHTISAVVGNTWQASRAEYLSIQGSGYTSDILLNSLQSAPATRISADNNNEYKYTAVFARIGYDWRGKYLLNLTGRRDGSSRFGPGRRFGNFGAVGTAWIFSDENLFKDNLRFLSFGKIRGSYGITGSDQIGDYMFYDTYRVSNNPYQNAPSLTPNALYNPDYGWEATRKLEAAIELGFADNRISIEVSWYRNRTSNQLINYQLPTATGFASVLANFQATVQNSGWEGVISLRPVYTTHFKWTVAANVSISRNKLVAFPGIESSSYGPFYEVGKSLSVQRLYTWEGVDPQTGKHKLTDYDNDGVIDYYKDGILKDPTDRNYYGGINNAIQYKSFELSFLFQFSKQQKLEFQYGAPGSLGNKPVSVMQRWQKPGDITRIAKFSNNGSSDYYYVQYSNYSTTDASFIRLKTLTLSYTMPAAILKKVKLQDVKLFIQGQNLLTITNYLGFDPESGIGLPPLRLASAGIQFKL